MKAPLICSLLVLGGFLPPPAAQVSRGASPVAPSSATAVEASLVVRLPAGKTTYRIGEEIPLELDFRGTADKDYYFSTAQCGFFTRLFWSEEKISVTPADGVDDPLAEYFSSTGFAGSCLSSWHALDGTPLDIRVSMNDAVRFIRPGTYRVVVTSTRLGRYSRQPAPVLTSAPIDLTISPMDDAWAAAEVGRARDLIDRGIPADVRHGAAILRYLGTETAARALVDRYDAIAKGGGDLDAALLSSSHRTFIIGQMEAHVDSGAALDASYLSTLTRLRVLRDIPPTAGNAVARRDRTAVVQAEYDARWRAALARQPATAVTLGAELARLETDASPEFKQQIVHDLELHPAEATDAFVALPSGTQQNLLASETWPSLNRPWILPALRRMYAAWHGMRGRNPNGFVMAGDVTLKRLWELAPDEGRGLILQEIRTGEHGIVYDALAILPETSLPELDAVLQARYSAPPVTTSEDRDQDRNTTAWLMARYGSPALLPFVTGLLTQPLPGCDVEGGLIAYLLKHEPDAAMKRLDPNRARTARDGCVIPPLSMLAKHYWDDRVESAVVAQLMSANTSEVADAAEILGGHGSRAVKQPLLDRLAKWSAEWRDRAAALAAPGRGVAPQMIENNIVNALFRNRQIVLTADDVANIRALCVSDQCGRSINNLESDRAERGIK